MNDTNPPVDFRQAVHECGTEPIHIPGHIQTYGTLVGLGSGLRIEYAAENSADFGGYAPADLLGQTFDDVLTPPDDTRALTLLREHVTAAPVAHQLHLQTASGEPQLFNCTLHCNADDKLLVEIEPPYHPESDAFRLFEAQARLSVGQLLGANNLLGLCQSAAETIRSIIQFDRVMVYRFDQDQNGEVIAEACDDRVRSFLGLYYPATDIPPRARDLFLRNRVRMIADVGFAPIPLLAAAGDLPPLDLSMAVLRGVSPGHILYLHSMGSTATLTIAIIKENKLWGLFACHHHSMPRYLPYEVRALCDFLGLTLSAQIVTLEEKERVIHYAERKARTGTLIHQLNQTDDLYQDLQENAPVLRQIVDAGGVAVCRETSCELFGTTPPSEHLRDLLDWLRSRKEHTFYTDRLSQHYPPASDFTAQASGVLSIRLSGLEDLYLIWFRPEFRATITWGTAHEKRLVEQNGQLLWNPDNSFEQWEELVQEQSRPWQEADLLTVRDFRRSVEEIYLRQQLAESERQLREIMNALPVIAFVYRDDHVVFINYAAEMLTGYSRVELRRPDVFEKLLPLRQHRSHVGDDVVHLFELPLTTRQGTQRWVDVTLVPIQFEGSPAQLGTVLDVTDRREAQRRQLELEVERQHVEILANFVQDVSHDIRTPLTVIHTSLFILKRKLAEDADALDQLNTIAAQTNYLENMLESMLIMSRLDQERQPDFQPVNLNLLLHELGERLRLRASSQDQTLDLEIAPDLPAVQGDMLKLERGFANLIENAIHYTPSGGQITLTARTTGPDTVTIDVIDTGIGISPDDLPHIFERFYRADRSRSMAIYGSGLGLAITRRIIDMHHGTIEVESSENQGTRFRVTLPREPQSSGPEERATLLE